MTDTVSARSQFHTPPGPGVGQPVVRPRNGLLPKVLGWLFDHSELFLPVIRDILPIIVLKKKKLAFVTRNDDV
jgi:hypothetical protein